jgi:hypothetical protein
MAYDISDENSLEVPPGSRALVASKRGAEFSFKPAATLPRNSRSIKKYFRRESRAAQHRLSAPINFAQP